MTGADPQKWYTVAFVHLANYRRKLGRARGSQGQKKNREAGFCERGRRRNGGRKVTVVGGGLCGGCRDGQRSVDKEIGDLCVSGLGPISLDWNRAGRGPKADGNMMQSAQSTTESEIQPGDGESLTGLILWRMTRRLRAR